MSFVEITLPWHSPHLSPNARVHWGKKAKAVKAAKLSAYYLAKAAGVSKCEYPEGKIDVYIDYYPSTNRNRDVDNCLSSTKAALDGISSAMGVNDSRFWPHPDIKDELVKGGKVIVRIKIK